jgi:UDP-glucose 4-epimerase
VTTILVTGGAGFIGSNLADRLLAEEHRVIAVDDLSTGRIANLSDARAYGKAYTFFNMDVRAEGLISLFERHRPEVVFHLAAQAGVRPSLDEPIRDASINLMGTLNVIECAAKVGVRKIVYAASGGTIYGEPKRLPAKESAAQGSFPLSPYGISKKVVLDYLGFYQRYRGLDFTACALANVYGPRQDPLGEAGVIAIFCGKLRAGERPTVFGDGKQTRDYIYVGDVVAAMLAAAESKTTGPVNIGTGVETDVLQLVEALGELGGSESFEPELAPPRTGEVARISIDPARAKRELGWAPQMGLSKGLRVTLDSI